MVPPLIVIFPEVSPVLPPIAADPVSSAPWAVREPETSSGVSITTVTFSGTYIPEPNPPAADKVLFPDIFIDALSIPDKSIGDPPS